MSRFLAISLIVLGWFVSSAQALDSKQFISLLKEHSNNQPARFDRSTLEAARKHHYVFVKGFLNERNLGRYFAPHTEELARLGVPAKQISLLSPISAKSIADNYPMMRKELIETIGKTNRKAVIIAHSRGAVQALAFALQHPDFVRDHVKAIFLVQGPMGGSYLADLMNGEGAATSSKVPLLYQGQIALLKNSSDFLTDVFDLGTGIEEMAPKNTKTFWATMAKRYPRSVALLDDRIFYVMSHKSPAKVRTVLRAFAYYIHHSYDCELDEEDESICPNDGVIARRDQMLKEVGVPLVDMVADHIDLVSESRYSSAGEKETPKRRGLIRSIFASVAN